MFPITDPFLLMFLLLVGHAVADYGLQNEFVATAKNRNTEVGSKIWPYVLGSHGLIHGGMVAILTGVWWLGLAETLAHCLIDYKKCDSKITFGQDQALHAGCKVLWLIIFLMI